VSVQVIELPSDLRSVVDAYVLADPKREYGGFLFGTASSFKTFLPVPNTHPQPTTTYRPPDNWREYVDAFAAVTGFGPVAHVHTHPSHSIPSEQDKRAGDHWFKVVPYMVLIAPNAAASRTSWWVLDKAFEVQDLASTDEALEAATLLVARRYGFTSLGRVLMDRDGRILGEGDGTTALLSDPEMRTAYAKLTRHGAVKTKTEAAQAMGVSPAKADRLLAALKECGLVQEDNRWNRPKPDSWRPLDLFGRTPSARSPR
jgi:proteasome lid subunit RPN8/RPN11